MTNEKFVAEPYSEGIWRVTFKKSNHEWHVTYARAATEQEAIKKTMGQVNDQ